MKDAIVRFWMRYVIAILLAGASLFAVMEDRWIFWVLVIILCVRNENAMHRGEVPYRH